MKKTFFISLFLPLLVACQESDSDEGLSDWVSLSREGLTAIVINTRDDVVLELDQQASWSASATFSSGATLNYDDKVSWSSDAPTIVAVSDAGQVTALAEGVAHISATYKSHQDTKTVTASTATLQSIEFYPSLTTIDECSSSRVRARGTYSDGSIRHLTKKLSWQSSDDSLATIIVTDDSYAQITTHLEGNVTISASDESGRSNSTPIVIEDALSGLSLTPSSLTLKTGESAKFTASGQFNDGTFMDVSDASEWALAADEQSAFVDLDSESPDAGRVTAVAIGEAVLSASCGGLTVSQAGTVTVSDVITLTGLRFLDRNDPFILQADDTSENLSLFADYSDGSAIDVSIDAVWTILTGDSDFIDIGTAVGEEGNVVLSSDIATITENKSIVVRAAYDGLNAYIEIVVETP